MRACTRFPAPNHLILSEVSGGATAVRDADGCSQRERRRITAVTGGKLAIFPCGMTPAGLPELRFLVPAAPHDLQWWRRADYLKVHFAESWNEMHHLLIMESLGGSDKWVSWPELRLGQSFLAIPPARKRSTQHAALTLRRVRKLQFDRFLAQHIAVVYYWLTCAIYLASPRMAYNLMEQARGRPTAQTASRENMRCRDGRPLCAHPRRPAPGASKASSHEADVTGSRSVCA